MADSGQGDKSEKPTEKRMEETRLRGQMTRSADLQTLAILIMATSALSMTGPKLFGQFHAFMRDSFSHIHEFDISPSSAQEFFLTIFIIVFKMTSPLVFPILIAAVLIAGVQTRFQLAPKAFELNPGRMNPIKGFQKIFGIRPMIPAVLGIAKLLVILSLTWSAFLSIMQDPLFFTPSNVGRLGEFLGKSTLIILNRICIAMGFIALADYLYQRWQSTKDMMMSKQEVKDESKNAEGNPQVKARQRQRRMKTFRDMLAAVPQADAIITNPTHLAIAIRYDRKSMDAPMIVAKGARNNALKIREVAKEHKVPIIENKPLARLLFRYGRVGSEIPNQLFTAVAEILAYVYRINAYRYYRENQDIVRR